MAKHWDSPPISLTLKHTLLVLFVTSKDLLHLGYVASPLELFPFILGYHITDRFIMVVSENMLSIGDLICSYKQLRVNFCNMLNFFKVKVLDQIGFFSVILTKISIFWVKSAYFWISQNWGK